MIDIMNMQDKVKIDKEKITKCAKFVLKVLGKEKAELSMVFVNDSYIKRLNWKYRKVNTKTDVLAFPMMDPSPRPLPKRERDRVRWVLGDVVVSVETAKREADERKIPIEKEIYLYLVHGILHLVGYDDIKVRDRRRMREKEEELLKLFPNVR